MEQRIQPLPIALENNVSLYLTQHGTRLWLRST